MLSLLRGPGILRKVLVAATCVFIFADGATDLDDGDGDDVDGHVAHLVLLASTEEQVGDDKEVLVQLVNLVGHCSVKVIFLQQNDDENDTLPGYD